MKRLVTGGGEGREGNERGMRGGNERKGVGLSIFDRFLTFFFFVGRNQDGSFGRISSEIYSL